MSSNDCIGTVCFVPLDAHGIKFFGFSEFLTGLALMVLAWTIADIRYRFRIKVTPLPLQGLTFVVVAAVGTLTLLTDLWRTEQWLVPQGNILTPGAWQAILGSVYLFMFLTWAWFAFIRPPVYGRMNAKRYAQALYRVIINGSPSELAVIADELAHSAKTLIRYATDRETFNNLPGNDKDGRKPSEKLTGYANDILLLIADKRFCRAIIESSPGTALAFFNEIGESKKYGVQVGIFAKNIMNEAMVNRDSFLFHESEGYESGLIGYHKPLSQAMFSNYRMVETIETLLEPDIWKMGEWDAAQWKAYCHVVLMTFRDYAKNNIYSHSYVLYRAKGYIERAVFDLYKINGVANSAWNNDEQAKLRVIIEFIKDAVEILEKKEVPGQLLLRVRDKHRIGNFYDHLASMIFEVIFSASAVRSPVDLCWWVQHNYVWGELFNFNTMNGPAAKIVKFKVRRLIYDEIAGMSRFPNPKGAKILGFCLNVMGLTVRDEDKSNNRDTIALQKAVLSWTKKHFAWLHIYNHNLAEACLVDGIIYDSEQLKLVMTYPADGLRREPHYIYFNVDPPTVIDEVN